VVEVQSIHNLLSGNFGVDKVTQRSAGVIERVIKKILERCGENAGIKGLQRCDCLTRLLCAITFLYRTSSILYRRTLSIMDNNGDKRLTKEELK